MMIIGLTCLPIRRLTRRILSHLGVFTVVNVVEPFVILRLLLDGRKDFSVERVIFKGLRHRLDLILR